MAFTKQRVLLIYDRIVYAAKKRCQRNRYISSLKYIRASASWAYSFNFFYSDIFVEDLLKEIADKTLSQGIITSPVDDTFVFVDSFAYDNRGLTQQYLRAMMNMNVSILYILTNHNLSKGHDIFRELNEYSKATIYISKKEHDDIEKSQEIINQIKRISPSKIFLHLAPWDVTALLAIYKIKNVIKYNINLTDHAYWLGASFIDYNIEFRAYGKTVSLEKRNLLQEQEVCLPYYPICPRKSYFQGFPSEIPNDSIIILTGGAPYKMLGRNDIFFVIMDQLLDISPSTTIVVAGVEPSLTIFNEKLDRMRNRQRVFLIGNRIDINECFIHCDIFLGTYPTMGGLMTQYAAINAKPILAYHDADDKSDGRVEDVINQCCDAIHTYTDRMKFLQYAKKLIEDQSFRASEGKKNSNAVITPICFNQEFANIVHHNSDKRWNWDNLKIQYEPIEERYLGLQQENDQWKKILISSLKFKVLLIIPQLFLSLIYIGFLKLKTKICR